MGAIKLDTLKQINSVSNQNSVDQNVIPAVQYSYQDVSLDLTVGNIFGNIVVNPGIDLTDIKVSYDYAAIINSIENIFNSMPGQWLLNPALGIGLPQFLFQPIDQHVGEQIAQAIIQNLTTYEPRCTIRKIQVQGDPDNNLYTITLALQLISVSNSNMTLKGVLNSNSFKFTSI
jgi:phage baseplate assembly protein W